VSGRLQSERVVKRAGGGRGDSRIRAAGRFRMIDMLSLRILWRAASFSTFFHRVNHAMG
jgi:hypothetical protein